METTKVGDKYRGLFVYFSAHPGWHKARIKFFVLLITALCKMQTVCFERLPEGMDSDAKISSCLRRIQRFFADLSIDKDKIAAVLFSWLPCKSNLIIRIERTNRQFGKTDIHIFMRRVCYDGIAFPLLWKMLPKSGNSNCKERIALLQKFIDLFGKGGIEAMVGDREFTGNDWLMFLQAAHIAYPMRIKDNRWFTRAGGEKISMSWLLQGCRMGEGYYHPTMLYLDKALVYVSGMKLNNAEYLILVSYNQQQQALLSYKQRWQIEPMFKAFKTKGFHIGDTHLRNIDRIDQLVAVGSIAFARAYKAGIYVHQHINPIIIRKHSRKAHRFFKYGLKFITIALLVLPHLLLTFIIVLSCT